MDRLDAAVVLAREKKIITNIDLYFLNRHSNFIICVVYDPMNALFLIILLNGFYMLQRYNYIIDLDKNLSFLI